MPFLKTDVVPAFFKDHVWNTVDEVVEVTEEDAHELLSIVDAKFHSVVKDIEAKPPVPAKSQVTEPDPEASPK